ncbi:MAG: hypothetical protein MUE72_10460 [Chitinophagaceae bacterium]|nr:hypothetical protein [Chitinophagaceae bacterium]
MFAVIAMVITFFGKEVDDVLSFSIFLDCFGMSLSAATLLILRKRKQGEANVSAGFAKNITPLLCVLFVIAYGFVATAVVIDKPYAALTGVVLMVIFMVLYFVFYHKRKVATV